LDLNSLIPAYLTILEHLGIDQDQMNTYSFSIDGRYIFDFSMANDQISHRLEILDYLTPDRIVFNGHWNFFYPSILQDNSDLLAKKRRIFVLVIML
ncbi:hypothetical protein ACJX0J_027649, partial [Zea mays]